MNVDYTRTTLDNKETSTMVTHESRLGTRSQMYPLNLFVYNFYWGTWSRILRHQSKWSTQVEVNLAGNRSIHGSWERVSRVWIREHRTARDERDLVAADLPWEVIWAMEENLRDALIARKVCMLDTEVHVQQLMSTLLHEDLLGRIDWDKYKKLDNGGACFYDIQKA